MAKVIILSYHYPPFDVIASQRALGYAHAFRDSDFETIVFTHSWKFERSAWICDSTHSDQMEDGVRIVRTGISQQPAEDQTLERIVRRLQRSRRWKSGDFETHPLARQIRDDSKAQFIKLVEEEQPDLVLGIFSPHFNLDWAAQSLDHGAKHYALDFRDLWDVRANTSYQISGDKVECIKEYWGEWSTKAALLSTVSQPYADFLAQELGKSVISIHNGFTERKAVIKHDGPFTILHAGTFYPHQNLDPIFKLAERLKCEQREFQLRFIGVRAEMEDRLNALTESFNLSDKVSIQGRVPREEAMKEISKAGLLFYPCWEGFPGVYSGKIFEYISADSPILLLPKDENVVEELVNETQSGSGFSEDELNLAYDYTVSIMKGKYGMKRNWEKIDRYTRSAQCGHYVDLVKKML